MSMNETKVRPQVEPAVGQVWLQAAVEHILYEREPGPESAFATCLAGTIDPKDGFKHLGVNCCWITTRVLKECGTFLRGPSPAVEQPKGDAGRFPPQAGDVWKRTDGRGDQTFTGESEPSVRGDSERFFFGSGVPGSKGAHGGWFTDGTLTFVRYGSPPSPTTGDGLVGSRWVAERAGQFMQGRPFRITSVEPPYVSYTYEEDGYRSSQHEEYLRREATRLPASPPLPVQKEALPDLSGNGHGLVPLDTYETRQTALVARTDALTRKLRIEHGAKVCTGCGEVFDKVGKSGKCSRCYFVTGTYEAYTMPLSSDVVLTLMKANPPKVAPFIPSCDDPLLPDA